MIDQPAAPPRLSEKLTKAFRFAQKAHGKQTRKGTAIPYLSHPLAVAAIVLEYGGSQDQAAAALLHDTVEDCGVTCARLTREFGPTVSRIVKDCTDAETLPKPPWKARKQRYLQHLRRGCGPRSLLVSAADKLHNARAIAHDLKHHGKKAWMRFNAAPAEIVWYYESLFKIFRTRDSEVSRPFHFLVKELGAAVKEMKRLADDSIAA